MRVCRSTIAILTLFGFLLISAACESKIFENADSKDTKMRESIDRYFSLEKTNKIKVGFSVASFQEERWLTDRDIFVAKCKELGGEVIVQSANGDENLQVEQCKKLLNQNIDVLVIIPQDSEKAAVIVNEANKLSIPVVAYDRLIRNCSVDAHVTNDNIRIGELQAEALVRKVPKGNYILLGGAQTDYCAIQIKEGQMNVLKPYIDKGDIRIVEEKWVEDWNPFVARKIIENALAANNNIHAVMAPNDGTAGGVIQALAEKKLAGKVAVSGQDADLAGCQRIVEGTQSMTVYVPIKAEAEGGAEVAIKLAKGEKFDGNNTIYNGKIPVPTLLLTPIPVDKESIVDTVIRDGYQKFEEVFKNIPQDKWPPQK